LRRRRRRGRINRKIQVTNLTVTNAILRKIDLLTMGASVERDRANDPTGINAAKNGDGQQLIFSNAKNRPTADNLIVKRA
jgi:hypothetical protein